MQKGGPDRAEAAKGREAGQLHTLSDQVALVGVLQPRPKAIAQVIEDWRHELVEPLDSTPLPPRPKGSRSRAEGHCPGEKSHDEIDYIKQSWLQDLALLPARAYLENGRRKRRVLNTGAEVPDIKPSSTVPTAILIKLREKFITLAGNIRLFLLILYIFFLSSGAPFSDRPAQSALLEWCIKSGREANTDMDEKLLDRMRRIIRPPLQLSNREIVSGLGTAVHPFPWQAAPVIAAQGGDRGISESLGG